VKDVLLSGFEKVFRTVFLSGGLTASEVRLAGELYEEKYLRGVCSPLCPVSRRLSRGVCPYAR